MPPPWRAYVRTGPPPWSNPFPRALNAANVARAYAAPSWGRLLGSLFSPAAFATSFAANIYVANDSSNNVTIYNPSYVPIGTITDPTLSNPTACRSTRMTRHGSASTGALHSYLGDGTTLASTHTGGNTVGPWGPNVTDEAQDKDTRVRVLDDRAVVRGIRFCRPLVPAGLLDEQYPVRDAVAAAVRERTAHAQARRVPRTGARMSSI